MVRTDKLALGLVVVLIAGGIALAYTGMAEPYVSQAQLPGTPGHAFAGIVVMVLVAAVFAGYLDKRAWTATGRRADLETDGGSLLGTPDLVGTVRGRPVRARTVEVNTGGGGGEGSRSTTTYTVVQADLEEPIDFGAIVAHGDAGAAPPDTETTRAVTVDGSYTVLGDVSEPLAREILTERVRSALDALDSGGTVQVGDPTLALLEGGDNGGDSAMATAARGLLSGLAGGGADADGSTVSTRTESLLVDAAALDRRLEAVAAVADAVDERTA